MKRILMFVAFMAVMQFVIAQNDENTSTTKHFNGSIWATNNGISLIPSFNLGKPAVMFNFSLGGEKLSFDPQFRFSMEGKPWSFILWWRYQFVNNEKFRFKIGAHPAFSFKEIDVIKDGAEMEIIRVRRYLAGELSPTFKFSEKISLTPYWLYAHGVEDDITQHTNYIALQSSFSKLALSDKCNLSLTPQVYYLRMDGLQGVYAASSFTLAKNDFPLSASLMINQKIDSEIAGDDFIWSASLIYSFNNKYDKR
ncbi:hypothetical protein SLH46_01285 [Draconibacterium sp. IB214405]|uniref:hypothetical protein n=1 Tax=Draconibacterium sp. IB214405 TaxID=3097352 RepID=UPI002A0EEA51|nr:hypothetical protein [Draconibacterium sp. IB214405]MDX8337795.1 hypothetical protein [Draconibacterium sp. IB214405]